jgi:ATP-dependent RNA helicase SUPV3L1/SUV3
LRDKKVRLGPLLIFLPDLNKPAAVKLRAILWSLFHDAPLPAPIPRDGAMSSVVDITTANPDFYRAIGYPLYGPRVVRIDMLDRVINAVYDSANGGKFQAQHKMAEWMGCPIADLYAILEAMGHKRIEKPVEEPKEAVAPVAEVTPELPETKIEEVQTTTEAEVPKKQDQKKPELDWFMLRRGKAHQSESQKPARTERAGRGERTERPKKEFKSPDKQPFPAERYAPKGKKFDKKKSHEDGDRHDKKKFDKKREEKSANQNPRMYSAEAAETDNPFAILQNLKLK